MEREDVMRMPLDEFLKVANASLETFATATRQHQAEGTEGFVGERFTHRTEADWWREVAAYFEYTELIRRLADDRRSGVERRGL